MDISSASREQIAAEAIEWFLYFQNSDRQAKDHQALSEWLTRSPVHIEEFLALSATWDGLLVPDAGDFKCEALIGAARTSSRENESTNVRRLEPHGVANPLPIENEPRLWRRRWVGLAASIVVIVGGWIGLERWSELSAIGTTVGEQRSVTLSDGSVVILNTDSKVRVRWTPTERRIELLKGEGQFHVAKNPDRPFIVSTTDATVRAVGTVFNVRNERSGTQVAVLEGSVSVNALKPTIPTARPRNPGNAERLSDPNASGSSFDLSAGRRVAITVHGVEPDIGPSVEAVSAWTQRRLIFRDQRLVEVVAEFNRYRVKPLVIDDGGLGQIRISGVFDLSDPESLLVYLKSFETVNVEHADDGSLHLARAAFNLSVRK